MKINLHIIGVIMTLTAGALIAYISTVSTLLAWMAWAACLNIGVAVLIFSKPVKSIDKTEKTIRPNVSGLGEK